MSNQSDWEWQQDLLDRERCELDLLLDDEQLEREAQYLESLKANDDGMTFDDVIASILNGEMKQQPINNTRQGI